MNDEQPTVTQGTMRAVDGRALPLKRTDVRARTAGPVAAVTVTQVFTNDTAAPIEAVYLFPLPHEASVHRMEFRIDGRVVRGVVKEKVQARRAYERARSEGRAATLLEEATPSLFTLSVANVAPGATIEVEMEYQEVLAFDDGQWRFVFPMVAPERYHDAPHGHAAASGPRLPTGERGNDVSLSLELRGDPGHEVEALRCPSHQTVTERLPDGAVRVSLAPGAVANRDFVLTWKAGDAGVRPRVRFERVGCDRGTFLLLVTPSAVPDLTRRGGGAGDLKALRCGNCGGTVTDLSKIQDIPGLGTVVPCSFCGAVLTPGTEVVTRATRPRDVLVLVDRSASMRASLAQSGRAVRMLLDALDPGDAVQLLAFDHDVVAFDGDGSRFVAMSPELLARAGRFLSELNPRGGTELEAALERVAKLPGREGRTRAVVLLTDAAVGNEGRLLRRVPELLGAGTRLFVLGVGPAVDRRLVDRLARAGGGASDVLLGREDVEPALARFARRVREGGPVLTGLTLWWEGAGATEVHPGAIPDLHGGEPVRVLGRYDATGATKLVLTGSTAEGKAFRQELEVTLPAESRDAPGITRLWARQRVLALAEQAATAEPSAAKELRDEATGLSLRHAIVGPFTSLVAEDVEVSVKRVLRRKGVLRVVRGADAGRSLVLDRERVTIGRRSDCALVLHEHTVSRVHAEVRSVDDGFVLHDIASSNGTRVDGAVVRSVALTPGMTLELGGDALRFDLAEGPDSEFEVLPTRRVDVPLAMPDAGGGEAGEEGGEAEVGEAFASAPMYDAMELDEAPVRARAAGTAMPAPAPAPAPASFAAPSPSVSFGAMPAAA